MKPILTTITPYWNRPEMLTLWLKSVCAAPTQGVCHMLISPSTIPEWALQYECEALQFVDCRSSDRAPRSIGHYHNVGAALAKSDWIMKLDVDCIAHTRYFTELLPILETAQPRQWFNGGMYYMDQGTSISNLSPSKMPILVSEYYHLIEHPSSYPFPAGTNFICRRLDYLELGGCVSEFKGHGWEDYQQIYMLEHHQQQADPLPGDLRMDNVTQRCREEISRRKARELIELNDRLGLLHRWHPAPFGDYKNPIQSSQNRKVLFDYISIRRTACSPMMP